jgi:hypothetical protein
VEFLPEVEFVPEVELVPAVELEVELEMVKLNSLGTATYKNFFAKFGLVELINSVALGGSTFASPSTGMNAEMNSVMLGNGPARLRREATEVKLGLDSMMEKMLVVLTVCALQAVNRIATRAKMCVKFIVKCRE